MLAALLCNRRPQGGNSGAPSGLDLYLMRQMADLLARARAKAAARTEDTAPAEAEAPVATSAPTRGLPGSLERYRRQVAAIEQRALEAWTEDQRRMAALYDLQRMIADLEARQAAHMLRIQMDDEALVLILATL